MGGKMAMKATLTAAAAAQNVPPIRHAGQILIAIAVIATQKANAPFPRAVTAGRMGVKAVLIAEAIAGHARLHKPLPAQSAHLPVQKQR